MSALAVLPALFPLLYVRPLRKAAGSSFIWLATVGLGEAAYKAAMHRYIKEIATPPERLVYGDALRKVREHQAAGHRVVIATGAHQALAVEICAAIGLAEVEVVGSTLKARLRGYVAEEHCYGRNKLKMLALRGVDAWDYVYTDSAADLPILKEGKQRFVVNPTAKSLAKIQGRLGDGFTVLRWS